MKNKADKNIRFFYVVMFIVIVIITMLMSSCSSIKKLRSNVKQSSKIDSTHQQKSSVDSSGSNTITKIDSSGLKVEVEFEEGTDTGEVELEITVHKPSAKDYDQSTRVNVKSNKKPKGVTVDDTRKQAETKTNTTNVKRNDEKKTNVKKEEQKTVKQVEKKKFVFHLWWLLLLLIPLAVYVLYKKYPVPFRNMFSKLKNITGMKNLILVCSIITLFSSCWKWDKPTPPRELPAGVYQEERVPVYDSVYVLDVAAKQYVKTWGIARYKVVPIKEMEVVPTGKQVMKFSYFAGYGWLQLIGIILIAAFAYLLFAIHIANDHNHLNKAKLMIGKFATSIEVYSRGSAVGIIRGLGVLLIFAVGFLTLHPGAIAQNNAKTITEKQLKHYQSIDTDLNYFWDSVYKAGGITTIRQPK